MIATDENLKRLSNRCFTIRLGKFAQVGKPAHATPVATTEGTSLRVHQSPTAGNPPSGLDSPQRTGSTFRKI
ncbi:hypothetical protein [Nostoc sp. 106C]|uniref:hypothetical protein n=1 Tax=Nostoc sp. 106C TaxID=1932667 RepID=UPI00117DF625|nr:hypothetical protein [Nostoc sp. 106C]